MAWAGIWDKGWGRGTLGRDWGEGGEGAGGLGRGGVRQRLSTGHCWGVFGAECECGSRVIGHNVGGDNFTEPETVPVTCFPTVTVEVVNKTMVTGEVVTEMDGVTGTLATNWDSDHWSDGN
ncbi:unnamed protein product [Cuscuta epithymum]|uniref:Uncharacterized protein n=1 Tax=Cuscuta epithymum TaxID=186058 RepID=A0AAV0C1C9_9ASTE|nr:unnamed protein product [Cuscuta epithymum]